MELANSLPTPPFTAAPLPNQVRVAQQKDASIIYAFLKQTFYSHIHVDWYLPGDWLGSPGFFIYKEEAEIKGCLAVAADPLPAAWVRVAAVEQYTGAHARIETLLQAAGAHLQNIGATELNWMSTKRWADRLLAQLGFEHIHTIETYTKEDLEIPAIKPHRVNIRSVLHEDMRILARIEEKTFAPLWRHSSKALIRAWRQAISFDVALINGRIVGFQHSTEANNNGAHLARITVHPDAHSQGVGSALLTHAINTYRQRGFDHVSLNTQTDNNASQHLYKKFGFKSTGFKLPVWTLAL